MSKSSSPAYPTVAALFGAALLATFLFLSVKIGLHMYQSTGLNLAAISALVLFGLIGYVIVAAIIETDMNRSEFVRSWLPAASVGYEDISSSWWQGLRSEGCKTHCDQRQDGEEQRQLLNQAQAS
ncbi:hypothetical protein FKW77_007136 [Venturia effusa]|uniref:Uncharacterized protein n=1 Tax=Venturia effusa TaxID=50376 RepID=A0A517LCJ8_9PEZI|nr:hypothetical protein FKW77_007136 [Venturia effusa]